MFNPQPKPEKRESKAKMSLSEFRKKHQGKKNWTAKTSKSTAKKFPSAHDRFYKSPAWLWFARAMKLKYSDNQGMARCATSNVPMSISDKNCHLGHCIRVFEGNNTQMNVAFDERNVMPQTMRENRYFGGRPEVFRDKIDQLHGKGTYNELVRLSKQWRKYTDSELKDLAEKYRLMTYDLLEEKGLKKWW